MFPLYFKGAVPAGKISVQGHLSISGSTVIMAKLSFHILFGIPHYTENNKLHYFPGCKKIETTVR